MNVWLNPGYSDATLTPGGDTSLTLTGPDLPTSITHVLFRQAALQADDVFRADNLRIGTAWGDVVAVPEPGSLTLLALGGLATLLLVRRRS